MPTVAIYVRASTRRQAQSQSTEQQLERLYAYALAQGWDVAPEFVFRDDGYSGASLQRPGLDHLRDAAAGAGLDRIVIAAPDRLARNYVHQVLLVEELQRHGAEVEFLDRPMGRDPHDQLLLQIRGAVAEYERILISERMVRSAAPHGSAAAAQGRHAATLDPAALRVPPRSRPSARPSWRAGRRGASRRRARPLCLVRR